MNAGSKIKKTRDPLPREQSLKKRTNLWQAYAFFYCSKGWKIGNTTKVDIIKINLTKL